MDLDAFTTELRDRHAALTSELDVTQAAAETAWARFDAKKAEVLAFRKQYGKVLEALDGGTLKVGGVTASAALATPAVKAKVK